MNKEQPQAGQIGATLAGYIVAAEPLMKIRLAPLSVPEDDQRRSHLLGMGADAVRMSEGVLAAAESRRGLNALRLARHAFEASITVLYIVRFGDDAWRQLLAADAQLRIRISTADWMQDLDDLTQMAAAVGSIEELLTKEAETSGLTDWVAHHRRMAIDGWLTDAQVAALEAVPGWRWDPPDPDRREWVDGLRGAWAELLRMGELDRRAEWFTRTMDEVHRGELDHLRLSLFADLLRASGVAIGGPQLTDLEARTVSGAQSRMRDNDRRRRDAEAKGQREAGVRIPLPARGSLPDMRQMWALRASKWVN